MKKYLKSGRIYFVICVVLFSMAGFMSVFLAYISQMMIDTSTMRNYNMFFKTIILAVFFIILNFCIYTLRGYFRAKYLKKVMFDINHDLFKNIMEKNISEFSKQNSSMYVSIFSNDLKILEKNYFDNILTIISDLSQFIICLFAVFSLNLLLAAIIVVINIIAIYLPLLYGGHLSDKQNISVKKFAELSTKIKDYFNSFEIIKCFQINKRVIDEFDQKEMAYEESMQDFRYYEGLISGFSTLTSLGVSIVTMLISLYFVIINRITIGEMMAITQLVNNIANPLGRLSNEIPLLKSVNSIQRNINDIMQKVNNKNADMQLKKLDKICISDLTFGYEKNKDIIHNFTFNFIKGKKYAIVGNSGSGKTTLIKLILKYYDDYNGSILFNDTELKQLDYNSVYTNITIVHQNATILNDTLKNNILYYRNYSDTDLKKVISKSGLEKFVYSLPQGLDTVINENGNNISGGEKQRIGIARALLRNTPFIVYDEPTSNLDNVVAQEIEQILLDNDQGCIMITHKLNKEFLLKFDTILVLENGYLVEYGTFNYLINNKKYFYKLFYSN